MVDLNTADYRADLVQSLGLHLFFGLGDIDMNHTRFASWILQISKLALEQ